MHRYVTLVTAICSLHTRMINDIFNRYAPILFYTLQVWDGDEEEELGRGSSMCGDDKV